MKTKVMLLAALPLLLAGCAGGGASSHSGASSSVEGESSSQGSSSSSHNPALDISDYSYKFSSQDALIEIAVGRALAIGHEYLIRFSYTDNTPLTGTTIEVVNGHMLEAEGSEGRWNLIPKEEGICAIIIKDGEGIIRYRHKVRVLAPKDETTMDDYLVSVDHFQSWRLGGQDMQLTFIPGKSAIVTGQDDGGADIGSITFQYEYNSSSGDEFVYDILGWENESTTLNPHTMTITMAGDMIHFIGGLESDSYTVAVFQLPEFAY